MPSRKIVRGCGPVDLQSDRPRYFLSCRELGVDPAPAADGRDSLAATLRRRQLFAGRSKPGGRSRPLEAGRPQFAKRSADRALALAASSSRFLGGAVVSSDRSNRMETPATSSTAAANASSFAFDGLLKPVIFLTNCSEAARTSGSVTGGSKLKSVLMFRHMRESPHIAKWNERPQPLFAKIKSQPEYRSHVDRERHHSLRNQALERPTQRGLSLRVACRSYF
jgi:hypothetical protein